MLKILSNLVVCHACEHRSGGLCAPTGDAIVCRAQEDGCPAGKFSAAPSLASKAGTFAWAMLTGRKVGAAVLELRVKICGSCDQQRTANDVARCNLCGCRVTRLAAIEENLPAWGCKHPRRRDGAGWP